MKVKEYKNIKDYIEKKKDNSTPKDVFINCRSCDEYIQPNDRLHDTRYCMSCA